MGLGISFRVRLLIALALALAIWQSIRIWSITTDVSELSREIQVGENAENDGNQSETQKVLVTVYYEALCPDSRSFLVKQLEPTFKALRDHIQLQMVPYGKATTAATNDGYEFTCQHGPDECEANMIHACAIDIIEDPAVRLDFLVCMIKNNSYPQNITKVCAEKMNLDFKPILDCQAESRGKKLLAMYGKLTDSVRSHITFIPMIMLDKSFDNQPAILKNLQGEVCKFFKVLPAGCT